MRFAVLLFASGLALTACKARVDPEGTVLPQTQVTDPRYNGLVFLVATVRQSGNDFVVSNDSTQPWFDVTLAIVGAQADEYRLHLSEIDPGQAVTVAAAQFASPAGLPFNRARVMPRTLIVSAEIGEGGPTGVYAVRP